MKHAAVIFALLFVSSVFAQSASHAAEFEAEKKLAAAVLEAHGGAKLRAMKTLIVKGSVDVATSGLGQSIPATFVTIFSGDKYRLEILNPLQPFKQVYDGTQTSSSLRGGFTLPPINRLGLPLLPRIGETGFVITSLPAEKKGKLGFRITSPEGYFTDYMIDGKTNQIKGYDSTYQINGRTITTSVEIDKYRVVDGLTIPEKYAQRFDMEQISIYSTFKAKDILVNSPVADDVFAIAN
jgi:hypothetical protein